ncbi:3-isopropylmalate dehydrogenase [Aureibacter tunicatorum]|uniref:3-isopropylmalate dehydrogenase n=1 Tax=Aureibacter tunicatorum TaxID=866807 RepID=A0AAE3XJT0_9BACT|nr:3-isopropylmalate dehydrogenase [Aureibacter tunicatorum]MDR6237697.1 3-isopropylmalate dehydrogenase [Aureibacter tunicatorum]BDD02732.1 3-isopropylmalate dehydrogenase [Aureibacter tunicatorum]
MKKIAVLPGDGIGPEVVKQAIKALDAVAEVYNHEFEYKEALVGASAIDAVGDPFPAETQEVCETSDAILFGAIGDPKYDNDPKAKVRPEQGLLRMRKVLGLFCNIRPVTSYKILENASPLKPEIISGVDFVVFRELTGGIYFGEPRGRSENGETAFDSMVYSKEEIKRVSRFAFEAAGRRKKKLTLIDKANVLATSRLWRETVKELGEAEYPEIEIEYIFVDNAAMQMIQNPAQFDVCLTGNMFGDIITDEASVITGSLGLLPSASVGNKIGLYEPIHGSFPQGAGKNIANPVATILSAAMLLETSFGMAEEAKSIRDAVEQTLNESIVTPDIKAEKHYTTEEVGDAIAEIIKQKVSA